MNEAGWSEEEEERIDDIIDSGHSHSSEEEENSMMTLDNSSNSGLEEGVISEMDLDDDEDINGSDSESDAQPVKPKITKIKGARDSSSDSEVDDQTPGGRYFLGPGSGPKCFNCGESGHMSRDCSQKSKLPCVLCSQLDHRRPECPWEVCYNCQQAGHQSRDCKAPRKRRVHSDEHCRRCRFSGHLHRECSLAWRQYKFVAKPLNRASVERAHTLLQPSCYYCAEKGHFGDECRERSRLEFSIFHRPVYEYLQKCEHSSSSGHVERDGRQRESSERHYQRDHVAKGHESNHSRESESRHYREGARGIHKRENRQSNHSQQDRKDNSGNKTSQRAHHHQDHFQSKYRQASRGNEQQRSHSLHDSKDNNQLRSSTKKLQYSSRKSLEHPQNTSEDALLSKKNTPSQNYFKSLKIKGESTISNHPEAPPISSTKLPPSTSKISNQKKNKKLRKSGNNDDT